MDPSNNTIPPSNDPLVMELVGGVCNTLPGILGSQNNRSETNVMSPAAIELITCTYRYLKIAPNGDARTPQEVGNLVILGSFYTDIYAARNNDELDREILNLLIYSLGSSLQMSSASHHRHIGFNICFRAVLYALKCAAVKDVMDSLQWKLRHISSGTSHKLTLDHNSGTAYRIRDERYQLIDGLMLATVLYPQLQYQVTINGVGMIPQYDTIVQAVIDQNRELTYKITIPTDKLSHQYISVDLNNHRSSHADIEFTFPQFLQGLVSLTNTIGITTPWLTLDMYDQTSHTWLPASAT